MIIKNDWDIAEGSSPVYRFMVGHDQVRINAGIHRLSISCASSYHYSVSTIVVGSWIPTLVSTGNTGISRCSRGMNIPTNDLVASLNVHASLSLPTNMAQLFKFGWKPISRSRWQARAILTIVGTLRIRYQAGCLHSNVWKGVLLLSKWCPPREHHISAREHCADPHRTKIVVFFCEHMQVYCEHGLVARKLGKMDGWTTQQRLFCTYLRFPLGYWVLSLDPQ